MTLLFIIAVIIAGIFYFLWQEEREKLAKAEKEIKQLKKRKQSSQSSQSRQSTRAPQPPKKRTDPVTIEKTDPPREYIIRKPEPQPVKPLLDQKKLKELQEQTRTAQGLLDEIFVREEEVVKETHVTSTKEDHIELLQKLFTKEIWSRSEILELVGPNVMIGNLLERINDYSCSKIDDVVVEEDGDNIYVTTQYKNLLI